MTPRKASLQVAHGNECSNQGRSALDSLKGCTCSPSYYVLNRDRDGNKVKGPRVKDRATADKLLRAKQVEIDKGHAGYGGEQRNIAYPEWVDEYLGNLELQGVKPGTRRSYSDTLEIAKSVLGHREVRRVGATEVRRFYRAVQDRAVATQLRHLRQLSACLSAAVSEGYADGNPVPAFRKSLKNVKAPPVGGAPFTDGELLKLWQAMKWVKDPVAGRERPQEPVYAAVCRASVAMGARRGELIALDWSNVSLVDGTVTIKGTYNAIDKAVGTTKNGKPRTVYLTAAGLALFEEWLAASGGSTEGLVFPAPRSGGYLDPSYLSKRLAAGMTDARIPKLDPTSGLKRTFHSLRRTFTRQQLEAGRHPMWVQAALGHSSLEMTVNVYGAWTPEARRAEATRETAAVGAGG